MMSWWCAPGVGVVAVLDGVSPGVVAVAVLDGWGAGCGFGLGGVAVAACALRAKEHVAGSASPHQCALPVVARRIDGGPQQNCCGHSC